jgi:hypothetical protein
MLNASLAGFPSEDQFEKKHTWASLLTGKPLVLIGGNQRKTADYIKNWKAGLDPVLGQRALCVGLADLDSVPFFVSNNSVRKNLRENVPNLPILCDWDGKAFKALGMKPDTITVLVFRADGKLVGRVTGLVSPAGVTEVRALLEAAEKPTNQ